MNKFVTYLENVPAEYLWVSGAIVLFFLLAIISLCITLFYRGYKLRRAAKKKHLLEAVDRLVQEVIFEGEQEEAKRWMKGKSQEDVQFFLNRLLLIGRQFSGEYTTQISDFYNGSELAKLSLKNFRSANRRKVVRAIHEMTDLGYQGAEQEIEARLQKEKNPEIQSELGRAMLQFNPAKAFEWLLKQDVWLSEWQQLSVLGRVGRGSYTEIPPLEAWVGKNESLLILGCRLSASQNRYEDLQTLLKLLGRDSEKLKTEAILALLKLEYEGLGSILQAIYPRENKNGKILILQSFQKIRDALNLPFLLDVLSDGEFEITMEAMRAIYKSNRGSFEGLSLPEFAQTDLLAIRKHIEDKRI
ncbi:MAG: hypothetical protein K0R65_2844 [Crocinitomicaceae bacterium]|jgi:hypothetical protein|nr:hypothetical protein [Crocinitomicaceae bacterium]